MFYLLFQNIRQIVSCANLRFDPNLHSLIVENICQGLTKDTLHFTRLKKVYTIDHMYKQKNNGLYFYGANKGAIRKTENIQTNETKWVQKERLSNLDFIHHNKIEIDFRLSISIEENLKK